MSCRMRSSLCPCFCWKSPSGHMNHHMSFLCPCSCKQCPYSHLNYHMASLCPCPCWNDPTQHYNTNPDHYKNVFLCPCSCLSYCSHRPNVYEFVTPCVGRWKPCND